MDRDFVIKEQVAHFVRKILQYERKHGGFQDFKQELDSDLLMLYDPVDKLTYLYGVHKILKGRMEEHESDCVLKSNLENCVIHSFGTKALFFIEQEIGQLNPSYEFTFLRPNLNTNLLKDNLIRLVDYPESAGLYQNALNKLNENRNERNILDDLRLSLELLLKSLLNNKKSLENQSNDLGTFLKNKGVSTEVRNMFITLIEYFSKYQNNYIKHNDLVKRDEIDLIVNLTGAFISFIISK
jgi:hypothetical protein